MNIYYVELFDYYGDLFTDKQKEYFIDYYFNNLTLQEIAENNNISKSDINNWNLSENWLVIDYYDDEGNLEFLDVPTEIFFDFIKNYKQ